MKMNWKPITEIPETHEWLLGRGWFKDDDPEALDEPKQIITFVIYTHHEKKWHWISPHNEKDLPQNISIDEKGFWKVLPYDNSNDNNLFSSIITHWAYIKDLFEEK